ncbi:MAG TPA: hypothetical protein DCE52_18870 [Rhodobacteraceae bacterium]|nr:hypothetical protein [Paracoccaceae bacterium]
MIMPQEHNRPSAYKAYSDKNLKLARIYIPCSLIIFGTAFQPFLGDDNRNFLLIGFMAISPLIFLFRYIVQDFFLLLFCLSIIIIQPLANPESIRWSTIFFTLMFSLSYTAYQNLLKETRFKIESFIFIVRSLMYAFIIVYLIQQVSVLVGFTIINESNYSITQKWKLNSLSAEASHAARIINILMFSYISLEELRRGENYSFKIHFWNDRYLIIGYLWMCLTMQSTTALIFLIIVLMKVLKVNIIPLLTASAFLVIILITLSSGEITYRFLNFVQAFSTFDYVILMEMDHSGSLRIAPLLVLSDLIDPFSFKGLFGHGIDSVSAFMSNYISGVHKGYTGGGMLRVWYEYGFFTTAFFIVFTLRVTASLKSISYFLFWLNIVFVGGPNNQIVWMYIMLFSSLIFFQKQSCQKRFDK